MTPRKLKPPPRPEELPAFFGRQPQAKEEAAPPPPAPALPVDVEEERGFLDLLMEI